MYHSPVLKRSPIDDEHRRRNNLPDINTQQLPPYHPRSPTHSSYVPYSPTQVPQSSYNQYSSRPSASTVLPPPHGMHHSPRQGLPSSPSSNGMSYGSLRYGSREAGGSYYDLMSEHREAQPGWNHSRYSTQSPTQSRDQLPPTDNYQDPRRSTYPSPNVTQALHQSPPLSISHAHPAPRQDSVPQSPAYYNATSPYRRQKSNSDSVVINGQSDRPASQGTNRSDSYRDLPTYTREELKPTRTRNPMAFSSILSSNVPDPPHVAPSPAPPLVQDQRLSATHNCNVTRGISIEQQSPPNAQLSQSFELPSKKNDAQTRSIVPSTKINKRKAAAMLADKENVDTEMAKIEEREQSDIDLPFWYCEKELFKKTCLKRLLAIEELESHKRKRRRAITVTGLSSKLGAHAQAGKEAYWRSNEDQMLAEIQRQELMDEKERKKDMQRTRRRERRLEVSNTMAKEAEHKADLAPTPTEREKYLRDADKAGKKAKSVQQLLERRDAGTMDEIREVTPLALNHEGGTMSSFQAGTQLSSEPPRKKQKGSTARPKKSKEKKQAEKDAAEAAFAAGFGPDTQELVAIAPKEEIRRETLMRETKEVTLIKDNSPVPTAARYASKGYNQIYDQIWKDLARKDVPKVYRIKETSLTTKQSNMRKTAQLAAKEARRWQLRTNKGMKDVQARAKRSMREMMSFWKRNEREERDSRRVAEKQELENAKKAEADREANRQKRKLNFLISQTELYSHFIGRKIKTDEVERSTDSVDVDVSTDRIQSGKPDNHTINLPDSVADIGTKVTNFEDLDFDAEDETVLRQAAMANAQNAVQQAQDRARAFNGEENQPEAHFDEGEMNFQNPTSLGDVDVSQPSMLTAQLKEYQLKGLNWLVNLYEQGINGILADEMGLGKTIQSISVMAYLAEKHNIWGPFLVIAPSSTLHNWQQEITRFVPNIKVLPYWGNAKDRKVLRKFWDRKHITYTNESPFHVLVTSYQLVVQDTQYFQKIRWQYMILDEAQAIKSSQSSRWKSLLGFHCRNRLLLTGTPIQNNMQELWALLHFIMPSLFDSHDEFSDWFSKDIESHAQSNTKLNEDQLKRLHMILKPFMLRRVKKHVQKELGDKIEEDVFCDLTYRQRAYYGNLRNRISIMDLIEKAAIGDDQDTATLMNLVMQFRKVCNHPDLFERAETISPLSLVHFAETASFLREGNNVNVGYSTRNLIEYDLPRLLCTPGARIDVPGPDNDKAGFRSKYLGELMNIWTPENIQNGCYENGAFAWLRFADTSVSEAYCASHQGIFERAVALKDKSPRLARMFAVYHEDESASFSPSHCLFSIVEQQSRKPLATMTSEGRMQNLLNISRITFEEAGLHTIEPCSRPAASAPPITIACSNQASNAESRNTIFNIPMRKALYGISELTEEAILDAKLDPYSVAPHSMLPEPLSQKARFTKIEVPSMRRFVTDSGKLAKLDQLLRDLRNGGHRVLIYFQMTRMIDLMEEYLTYRNYKYLRLDGSTKLEDRRDTVHDFQTRPEIFIFLLSTRAGGLGINLTSADTVIFYDSDWNPTIDSQAMDRAHRLGQTKQVTVYRMITRGTIEERIRKRALQKEEVQRVVISGGNGAGVDFNTRSKENRTKDIAMWLADDEQAELIEKKEKEVAEKEGDGPRKGKKKTGGRKKDISLDDMYHEGEGHFDDGSSKPSGAATPMEAELPSTGGKKGPGKGKGLSKKAKTAKQRLAIADAEGDLGMGGGL